MRLAELYKPKEIDDFRKEIDNQGWDYEELPNLIDDKMKANGFEYAGEGSFSYIYMNPKYPFVLKVFADDFNYIRWFKFSKANQNNPFIPGIRGSVIQVIKNESIYAVRLEKLKHYDGGHTGLNPDSIFFVDVMEDIRISVLMKEKLKFNKYLGKNDYIDVIIHELAAAPKEYLDIHEGNIMLRGNQAVLIDPYYTVL